MRGYSLLELLVVLALSSLLMLGLVQMMSAGSAASLEQDRQARLQHHARLAISAIRKAIRPTGFSPEPWNTSLILSNPLAGSADGISAYSDRLVSTRWSDTNCFDYRNPDKDARGEARFYLRETRIDLSTSRQLAVQCRYGPAPDSLVTQVRRQGMVPDISRLQFEYGEDRDHDGRVDTWSVAGDWLDASRVTGVKVKIDVANEQHRQSLEFQVALPGRSG